MHSRKLSVALLFLTRRVLIHLRVAMKISRAAFLLNPTCTQVVECTDFNLLINTFTQKHHSDRSVIVCTWCLR